MIYRPSEFQCARVIQFEECGYIAGSGVKYFEADRDGDYFVAFGNLNVQDMEVFAQHCLSAFVMLSAFAV